MEETKPMIQSVTLWVNALLPVIVLLVPQLKEALTPEAIIAIMGVINAVIRIFKTDKAIEGVI